MRSPLIPRTRLAGPATTTLRGPWRSRYDWRQAGFLLLGLTWLALLPDTAHAQNCGAGGERACCVGETSFGACRFGTHEVAGCSNFVADCDCRDRSGKVTLFDASSRCVADTTSPAFCIRNNSQRTIKVRVGEPGSFGELDPFGRLAGPFPPLATGWSAVIPAGGVKCPLYTKAGFLQVLAETDDDQEGDFICNVQMEAGGSTEVNQHDRTSLGVSVPGLSCRSTKADDTSLDSSPYRPEETADDARDVHFLASADCQYWSDTSISGTLDHKRLADEVAARMRAMLAFADVRGIVMAGDLTQRAKQKEWEHYARSLGEDGYATYDGLGNHDIEGDHVQEILANVRDRKRTTVATHKASDGRPHYSWDWHDVHFVQLNLMAADSPVASSETLDPKRALAFLQEDLALHVGNSGRPIVLVHHYGFDGFSTRTDPPPVWWDEAQRAEYWRVLAPFNVIAIVTGHQHLTIQDDPFIEWERPAGRQDGPRKIFTFIAGAARGNSEKEPTGSFTDVDIQGDWLRVQRMDKDGRTADASANNYASRRVYIGLPTAVIAPAPPQSCAGVFIPPFNLDGRSSVDPGGTNLTYRWTHTCSGNFEDSGNPALPRLRLTACPQTCSATLEVTNDWGRSAQASVEIKLKPRPVLRVPPALTVFYRQLNHSILLEDAPGEALGLSAVWGDGTRNEYATTSGPFLLQHDYSSSALGDYSLSLELLDVAGAKVSAAIVVRLEGRPPAVSLTGPERTRAGHTETYRFTASDPDGANPPELTQSSCGQQAQVRSVALTAQTGSTRVWNLECAFTGTAPAYEVSLTAKDADGLSATATRTVRITSPPLGGLIDSLPPGQRSFAEGDVVRFFVQGYASDGDDVSLAGITCGGFAPVSQSADKLVGVTLEVEFVCRFGDDAATAVSATVRDVDGDIVVTLPVTIRNVAPSIVRVQGPPASGFPANAFGTIAIDATDAGGDPLTATIEWGEGGQFDTVEFQGEAPGAVARAVGAHEWLNPGSYTVRVTVRDGDGGEASATLDVTVENSKTFCVLGLVNWFQGEGDWNDVVQNRSLDPVEGVGFAPGYKGQAFSFNGDGTSVPLPAGVRGSTDLIPGRTFEMWIKVRSVPVGGSAVLSSGLGFSLNAQEAGAEEVELRIHPISQPAGSVPPIGFTTLGEWTHVAIAYDDDAKTVLLFLNGRERQPPLSLPGAEIRNARITIGGGAPSVATFDGEIDEIGEFDAILSQAQVNRLYLDGKPEATHPDPDGRCAPPDGKPPVFLLVPPSQTREAESAAGAQVSFAIAAAFDEVDGPIDPTCSPASGALFPLGTHTVTCTATDRASNSATASFSVTVRDTIPPQLGMPAPFTVESSSAAGVAVTYAVSANDRVDGAVTPSCAPATGATFPRGTTLVSCSASDRAGNTANGSFNVTVVVTDATPPALILPPAMTVEASGPGGAAVTFTASATDDFDGPLPVSCAPASGSSLALGSHAVTCSAADAAGNTASASFTVTVVDTTPPALSLPAPASLEATGPTGAVHSFSATAADLVDGTLAAACAPPSGSVFPLGTTSVTCSATDSRGNTRTGSFPVVVFDATPPALAVPDAATVEATGPGGAGVTFAATATDIVDGRLTPTCSPASGSSFALGTTLVSCSVTDSHGNTATGTFVVTVRDTTPPSLTVPAGLALEATGPSGAAGTFTASASDVVAGSLPVSCAPASGSTFPLGATPVTCTATDAAGNIGSASFNVNVVDTTPPKITLSVSPEPNGAGWHKDPATIDWTLHDVVGVSDSTGCDDVTLTEETTGTLLTCTAKDAAGNTTSKSVTVKLDRTAPAIVFGAASPGANANGWHRSDVSLPFTISDAVSGLPAGAPSSGTLAFTTEGAGLTQSVTAVDVAGNETTAGSPAINIDRTAPAITCAAADGLWHPADVSIDCTVADGGAGLANPADAAFSLTTAVPAGTETADAVTDSRNVCDAADNCATAAAIGGNKVDKKAPALVCGAPDGLWHATDQRIGCTAADGGAGLANAADAAFSLTTAMPAGAETANASTNSHLVCDLTGNCATGGPIAGNRIDKKAPDIVATRTPDPNLNGWNNTDVAATFVAADGGSGVAGLSTTTVLFTGEGANQSATRAFSDNVGNTSSASIGNINIDKTMPAGYNQFDPITKTVQVFGRDALSGVAKGPIEPLSVERVHWHDGDGGDVGEDRDGDDDDDDCGEKKPKLNAELRTYRITDLAGNSFLLVERVKQAGKETEVEVVSFQYDGQPVVKAPKNSKRFEWSVNKNGSLRELEQKMTVGRGRTKSEVVAHFDAKKNRTQIIDKRDPRRRGEHDDDDDHKKIVRPGLALLRLAVAAGTLVIEYDPAGVLL